MKTITAIVLNIVYPGAGYLYLKDPFRKQIAIFLVGIWTLFIGGTLYELIKALITGNYYFFNSPLEIPGLAIIMWTAMSVDTYFLARKLERSKLNARR